MHDFSSRDKANRPLCCHYSGSVLPRPFTGSFAGSGIGPKATGLPDRTGIIYFGSARKWTATIHNIPGDAPVVASNLAVAYAWTDQPDLVCGVIEEWVNRLAGIVTFLPFSFQLPGLSPPSSDGPLQRVSSPSIAPKVL